MPSTGSISIEGLGPFTTNRTPEDDDLLHLKLAAVLPKGYHFGIYHISTPPTLTDALYAPPLNTPAQRTYCESHFLAVTINAPSATASTSTSTHKSTKQVLVLGIEVLIYTTSTDTTLFVSKADSTGFLHLLNLPKGTPSPIREVCTAFLLFLAERRRRTGLKFILSLFARAQPQYLFPGSVDNDGKHVLDDRALIKWWCRVLNPLLRPCAKNVTAAWKFSKGYLVVPGLETHETKALVPRETVASWGFAPPFERISFWYNRYKPVPLRSMIPHFPDDPKARFLTELDEEALSSGSMRKGGSWKSIKTLDTFWEMMSYRQECSSGRMTGFIWLVFDDEDEPDAAKHNSQPKQQLDTTSKEPIPPNRSEYAEDTAQDKRDARLHPQRRRRILGPKKNRKLTGPIFPRQPVPKTPGPACITIFGPPQPGPLVSTPYYVWPPQGRGERILQEANYKRVVELLMHLDFSTLEKTVGSSQRWISETGLGDPWGHRVTGQRPLSAPQAGPSGSAASSGPPPTNDLTDLVKRKRTASAGGGAGMEPPATKVNVLSAGLIKREAQGLRGVGFM